MEALHYAACRLLGIEHSLSDLPDLNVPIDGSGFTTLPSAFFVARALSALCGVALVWVAYRIGRAISSDARVGLLSALLLAVSPSVLRDSRWMSADAMVTLAATASVLASVNVLSTGRAKDYLLASLLTGLTASLKYNGALVGVSIGAAAMLRDGRRALRNPWLYAAPLLALAAFLLTSPYAVLDFQQFWRDFTSEHTHYATGHDGTGGDTLAFYSEYLIQGEGLAALLALGGLVSAVVRRNAKVAVVGAFCVSYFCFINTFVTRNGRTLVPVVPTLLVIAAWFSVECFTLVNARYLRDRAPPSARKALGGALIALLAGYPLSGSLQRTATLLFEDNRELAGTWIDVHVPPHAHIAIERYSCYINRRRYSLKATRNLDGLEPNWLRQHEDYLIFAGDSFIRYLVDPGRYPRQAAKYRALFRDFELGKAVDDLRHGGEVRIYRTHADAPFLPDNHSG